MKKLIWLGILLSLSIFTTSWGSMAVPLKGGDVLPGRKLEISLDQLPEQKEITVICKIYVPNGNTQTTIGHSQAVSHSVIVNGEMNYHEYWMGSLRSNDNNFIYKLHKNIKEGGLIQIWNEDKENQIYVYDCEGLL